MSANSTLTVLPDARPWRPSLTLQQWGGLASLVLAVVWIYSELLYFSSNLREPNGALAYSVADLLYGPVRAACLVIAVLALVQRLGEHAPRRRSLVLPVTVVAAALFVLVAFIRASNRQYHLAHPELHLEENVTILLSWTTLVAGLIAAAWHGLGWSLLLLGTAGYTSGRLPRALCGLYCAVGAAALFVYLQPELEGFVILFGAIACLWQGVYLLWTGRRSETPAPKPSAGQPGSA